MSDKAQYGLQLLFGGDFTSVFGSITVSMVPASLLIVVTPIYVRRLLRKKAPVVKRDWLLGCKTAAVITLIGAEFGSAIVTCTTEELRTKAAVSGSILSFIGSLCIATMMYIQHMYSYKLSTFLSIFMSFTLIFHVLQARSYFQRDRSSARGVVSAVTAVSKALLMLLEEIPKQRLPHSTELSRLAKESIRGFWNRTLFIWLNSVLALGFKKIMSIDDLQDLGADFESEALYQEFLKNWSKDKISKHILVKSCLHSLGWKYHGAMIPRLFHSAFNFSQPYLFYRILDLLGEGGESIPSDVVTSILWTTVFIYFGIAVSRSYYMHICNRAATCVRGMLATAISDKMLRLSPEELEKYSVLALGEESLNEIEKLVKAVHNAIASVIDIAIALFVLYTVVGSAAFLLLIPTSFSTLLSLWATARMGDARGAWFTSVEDRVAATSRILTQLKSIKIVGLEARVSTYLQLLRRAETKSSFRERHLRVVIHFLDLVTDGAAAVFVFAGAIFWAKKDQLGVPEIFVTFSVIFTALPCLQDFLLLTPYVRNMYTCIMHFQEFLLLEEPQDRCNKGPVSADKSLKMDSVGDEKPVALSRTDERQHSRGYAIYVSGLSIPQTAGNKTLLHNASVRFRTGSVTIMIGQIGCGKSAFLKAILGEGSNCNGRVTTCPGVGSIAYCGQTPWLRNASIRDNIIGHCSFDALWYKKVIKACALMKDLNQLPKGDLTLTGSGGAKLSGGQKHRVALARAIYSRAPVVILDDIFRALDSTTSDVILTEIFGKRGILRQLHTTVIITTSSLQHTRYADVVLAFDAEGKINVVPNKTSMLGAGSSLLRWLHRGGETQNSDSESISGLAVKQAVSVDEMEDFERKKGDFSLYTYYWNSADWLTLSGAIFGLTVAGVSNRMLDVFVRIWIDESPNKEIYFPAFVVLGFSSAFIAALSIWFYYLKLIPKCADGLHNGLLQTVIGSTLSFVTQTETGTVLNRFGQDMTHISNRLPQALMEFLFMLASTAIDVAAFSSASQYTLVLIPLFILFAYCIQYFYLRTSRQIRLLELEAKASLYTRLHESSNGVHHLRAFKWQRSELQSICKLLDRYQKSFYYRLCIQQWLALALDLSVLCIVTLVVTFALYFPGSTTQAATGLSLSKLICFTQGMAILIFSGSDLENFLGSVRRTRKFNKETPVERLVASPVTVPGNWPTEGGIKFTSVTAKYGIDNSNTNTALRDLSLTIHPGQKVGIMGRTGSGKSSLLLSILNLLNFSGQILIDGISIQEIPYEILRTRIITIAQDGVELDGSIRDNIDAYSDAGQSSATDEMMVDILQRVRLWDKVESSGGLDATLAEVSLSEGQKQLLALSRAILRKKLTGSKVVLVDEATSSIDYETDKLIQEVMADAFSDCTTVTVAHRLQSLESADLVLEMESGRIRRKLESDSDEWQSLRRVSLEDDGVA